LEPGALVSDEKEQAKADVPISARFSCRRHRGTFLSQAGPHSRLALSQGEHRPFCDRHSSPETTKATRWVALAWSCYAASFLARTPLSEGWSETGPGVVGDERGPARHRCGAGRFGEIRCVGDLHHGVHGVMPKRRIDQTSDDRKGSGEKFIDVSNELRGNAGLKSFLD
jgi:hypothetical protein